VALVGPAGIGKTRIALVAAERSGLGVRRTAALDHLQAHPYFALERVVGRALPSGDAAAVCAEVRSSLADALLVLDDLQWADPDTIEALPALAAGGPLVVTVRPGTDAARRTIKHFEAIGEVIDVEPLDSTASAELVRSMRPHASTDEVAELIRAAGGLPLALEAMAHSSTQDRGDSRHALRAVIDACPHRARHALARIGLRDEEVDAETTGVSDLVDRRLAAISTDGTLAAVAVPFAELALASLAAGERAELHRRRAAQTEDRGESAAHWAAAGERDLAYTTALAAADGAETQRTRAQLLTLAADNAPDDELWSTTRLAVVAWLDAGDVDATRQLVQRLADHEPPSRADAIDRELIQAAFAMYAVQPKEVVERTDALEAAHGTALTPEQRSGLHLLRAAAKGELFDIPGTLSDARAAIAVGEEHGLSTTRARVILAAVDMVIGDERWRTDLPDTFRRAADLGELSPAFEAARLWALAEFFAGDVDVGVAACHEAVRFAQAHNNRAWERAFEGLRAGNLSLCELCDPVAVDDLRRVVEDPALGQFRHPVAVLLAIAESDLGNIARADELIEESIRSARHWRSQSLDGLLWARAELAWNAGRLDECLEFAEALLAQSIPLDFGTPAAAVSIRWVQWERHGACADAPWPTVIYPVQLGLLDEARAIELSCQPGREREAAEAFLRAAHLHDRYLKRNAWRCRWAAGDALHRGGDSERAAALLREVHAVCLDRGLVPLRRRVEASLRRVGPSTIGSDRPRAQGLTPREREVLELVREGLSTAAIAARLHVQPSTVDSHVRKSMKRLGAHTRREAALLALKQPS
jgi:DNA-binding CsgD family transcriptional regulator